MIILYILFVLNLVAVVFCMIMGGRAMITNRDQDRSASNKWMWRRIWAQASAFILLILIVWIRSKNG